MKRKSSEASSRATDTGCTCVHEDAIGYLRDLSHEIDEPWFEMICDCASGDEATQLEAPELDTLCELLAEDASYTSTGPTAPAVLAPPSTASVDPLVEVAGFRNFKKLDDGLRLSLDKRITVVFGANGSGKSSICEALKVLSSPRQPERPLNNVRSEEDGPPSFTYRFKSDSNSRTWSLGDDFGLLSGTIKYFDTDVAMRNVKAAVEPGRIIEVTPFRLHVFECTKALMNQFRDDMKGRRQTDYDTLSSLLDQIRQAFDEFDGLPLATIDDTTVRELDAEIAAGEAFADQDVLKTKVDAATELRKATSDTGLKLLKSEHRELASFLDVIDAFTCSTRALWALEPAAKRSDLADKKAQQEDLAKSLVFNGESLDDLLVLVRAASRLCDLESASGKSCPLCRRALEKSDAELFQQYFTLLTGELEQEIVLLKSDLDEAEELAEAIKKAKVGDWNSDSALEPESFSVARTAHELVTTDTLLTKKPTLKAKKALKLLQDLAGSLRNQLDLKSEAINVANSGKTDLLGKLERLEAEIRPLDYACRVHDHLETLKSARGLGQRVAFWDDKIEAFPHLLTQVTNASKAAHEQLVVRDFEDRLNKEYLNLTEMDMAAFGVGLKRTGVEARVTVQPKICGEEIDSVLSEGELRVHALALFFAELESCPQSVLVFDDPISSFDYNYIANYCERLRDYALSHHGQQIIALTHNWEFFVQLQTTLNKGGLNNDLSVQVVEDCSTVDSYSEKVDELRGEIESILAASGEPDRSKKWELAGKLRILIESVVNTYVFNGQRSQYKQKGQSVSVFTPYTKVVRLLPSEATELEDLYSKLSVPEHDDLRNAFVQTSKTVFQTRYDRITAVADAVRNRR